MEIWVRHLSFVSNPILALKFINDLSNLIKIRGSHFLFQSVTGPMKIVGIVNVFSLPLDIQDYFHLTGDVAIFYQGMRRRAKSGSTSIPSISHHRRKSLSIKSLSSF